MSGTPSPSLSVFSAARASSAVSSDWTFCATSPRARIEVPNGVVTVPYPPLGTLWQSVQSGV